MAEQPVAPPGPPPYLRRLVLIQFGHPCRAQYYCVHCPRAVCTHCCRDHTRSHHPQLTEMESGFPHVRNMAGGYGYCVEYEEVNGRGYVITGIRHLPWGVTSKYLPLRRRDPAFVGPPIGDHQCENLACRDALTPSRFRYCAYACRLAAVPLGNNARPRAVRARLAAQAMVLYDFDQANEQDCFCTFCFSFFSSHYCESHVESHHGGNALARIINVHSTAGRMLVPAQQLPPEIIAGLERFNIIDDAEGVVEGIQVRAHALEHAHAGAGAGVCAYAHCLEHIGEEAVWCSLSCKARALNWWVGF
ncbi:hypothetical protein ZWY2020_030926 [Hordeum vulgare]|nr:hypothetical protein ZWY2020_030926 [Hordeum vulgare]